jgi:microsomal epoxide hydrolase
VGIPVRHLQNHVDRTTVNFFRSGKPTDGSGDNLTESEQQAVERTSKWMATSSAYSYEHGTRTATIGFALAASPVALLAWIGEKFLEWTDKDPDVDEILRSVSLYWLTDTFPRCIYPYRQLVSGDTSSSESEHIKKPFGFSYFPHEVLLSPKSWIAAKGNLVWFRAHDHVRVRHRVRYMS